MEDEKTSTIFHIATGVVGGYISSILTSNIYAVLAAFLILYITGKINERLVEQRGIKWWIGNGAGIYILMWLIFFFNL
ncbi:MAG: hypothetical protein ABEJ72_02640 [Candidatus Aenigmatarchaeota archaeon]